MFQESSEIKISTIAESVLKLSDFYIENPLAETPWDEKFCQIAYRYYYLPLNFLRCEKVIGRGFEVGFFSDLHQFIDWGAGPGTASLALNQNAKLKTQIQKQILFDISEIVLSSFSDLHRDLIRLEKSTSLDLNKISSPQKSCLVFSYSLTEVDDLPQGWKNFEALMIMEPSTSQDGRKLLQTREQLIQNGYSIWAPCTHEKSCPLLLHSKNDWCHDRVKVDAPEWFLNLEQNLPMKNKTVTTSYILARRRKPPEFLKSLARLTGDNLEEKGKNRQLFCRGEEREFLSWMHKKISPQVLDRGELIEIPQNVEIKSNEVRLSEDVKIYSPI